MRMWMISPHLLCRKHLLGEHVEIHMLCGAMQGGKSLAGHLERGQLEPQNAQRRHLELVVEMARRGYNHRSPLPIVHVRPHQHGYVNAEQSQLDLIARCPDCRARAEES